MIKAKGLMAVVLVFLFGPSYALDLLQSYQKAKQYDAGYQSAYLAWQAAETKRGQGRAQFRPTVGLSSNTYYRYNNTHERGFNHSEAGNVADISLRINQTL